jgi:hypothetical protein
MPAEIVLKPCISAATPPFSFPAGGCRLLSAEFRKNIGCVNQQLIKLSFLAGYARNIRFCNDL